MEALPDAFTVGTAGHIDHGKTSLVKALTGTDLDRDPEERRRGITIRLGFVPLELPGGRVASFVDVPGHERLVRTMISGACGLDAVVLCVSAVDGVMPQTREHLAILDLLGVERGVIALTMADLVDPDMLELAQEDVADAVEGTFLEGAPIVPTSAVDRTGLDALTALLDALAVDRPQDPGPFRLPVDRTFVQKGFGVVVTGTVRSGQVQDGDELRILPEDTRVRVRGLQVHGAPRSHSRAGLRTALNLVGAAREELPRGTVVAGPDVPVVSVIDARYRHLGDAPPLEPGTRVRLLTGTTEVLAVLDPLDAERVEPGWRGLVQLRTSEPIPVLPGDRYVVRRESPITTLGGGELLDVWAPRHRRRDRARAAAELERLRAGDRQVLLERAGPGGLSVADAALRAPGLGARLGDRVLADVALEGLDALLVERLDAWHADNPLAVGVGRRALHQGRLLALSAPAFDALIRRAVDAGRVELDGPRLRAAGWQVRPSPEQQAAADAVITAVAALELEGPKLQELRAEHDPAVVTWLIEAGRLVRVGERVLARGRLDGLADAVRGVLAEQGELTTAAFKDLSGLSRRHAIPLLEWLDASGITRRDGDTRRAGPSA